MKGPSFEAFTRLYEEAERKLKSEGMEMYVKNFSSYEDYKHKYYLQVEYKKELISKGQIKSIGNINRDILEMMKYKTSYKQAHYMRQALSKTYEKVKISDIRKLEKYQDEETKNAIASLWEDYNKEYHKARQKGLSAAESTKIAKQTIFGGSGRS